MIREISSAISKAVVEFALRREDLGADFRAYLKEIVGAM